jgi:hypothetical protein
MSKVAQQQKIPQADAKAGQVQQHIDEVVNIMHSVGGNTSPP